MQDDSQDCWPTTNFACGSPEQHRDAVPEDVKFLRACGVRPVDLRDELLVLRGES